MGAHLITANFLLSLAALSAGSVPNESPAADVPSGVRFSDRTLPNGLRLILSEDQGTGLVVVHASYAAGSGDEEPGRTGLAHLTEHMMFQGSANIAPGQHAAAIRGLGGAFNGATGADRTTYYEIVPSNGLSLSLSLEADRMRGLKPTASILRREERIVIEERRLRFSLDPVLESREYLSASAYDNPAYRHSALGDPRDIEQIGVDDVNRFHSKFYNPSNLTLTLVGHFSSAEALGLVKRLFSQSTSIKLAHPTRTEPEHQGPRRLVRVNPLIHRPRLDIGYLLPRGASNDWFALYLAGWALAYGPTSVLNRVLVQEYHVATEVSWSLQHRIGTPLGHLSIELVSIDKLARAEELVQEALNSMAEDGIDAQTLDTIANSVALSNLCDAHSLVARADLLSQYATYYGDPELINSFAQRVAEVSSDALRKAVARYFSKTNQTLVITNVIRP